jgi:glycosyltransferase involved in cell wall biosynthesis
MVSLIVNVYKDIQALDCIVESLRQQTYKFFELIIAEDGDSKEMKGFVSAIKDLNVQHTRQKDNGTHRKGRSINNAVLKSRGKYLIFIDGDCIPYTTFIQRHVALAEKGKVLVGRRISLGKKMSKKIRDHKLSAQKLENSFTGKLILSYQKLKDRTSGLGMLGCNFSCFKKDMLEINGFDESYTSKAVADDTDLQWRFEALGLKMKSCKFAANVFHLYHPKAIGSYLDRMISELEIMWQQKQAGNYKAERGLDSHVSQ